MQIINATWEKRNLNENVVEVLLEKNDNLNDIVDKLISLDAEYQVVKIPIKKYDYMNILQNLGFMYIETLFNIYSNVDSYISVNKEVENNTIIRKANKIEIKKILDEIKEGKVFNTDRISIDPYYSIKISGMRYYNWAKDIIMDGAEVYILSYNGNDVSFTINKCIREKTFDPILAGMLSKEINFGLGFLMDFLIFSSIKIQGGKKIITTCSSNNLPVLKLNLECGYKIKNIQYVYVKHKNK